MGNALEQAEDLMRRGRYPEAIEELRALLSNDPDNPELRSRVAEAYRQLGNKERAFHHFHKAASMFVRKHDILGAARMLDAANLLSPSEPDVLFRLAECLKILNRPQALHNVLKQLISCAQGTGDRRRLWALEELHALHPQDIEVAIQRALVLAEAGKTTEAVHGWKALASHLSTWASDKFPLYLRRTAEMAPDTPYVGVSLATILLENQRPRDALSLLVPYYEKYPDNVEVLESLLQALEAIGAHEKIAPARIELVKARTKLGQRALALVEIQTLLETAWDHVQALEVSAHACTAFGMRNESARIWFRLAELHDEHGHNSERDRALLTILQSSPNHEGALQMGARVLRQANRDTEARSLEQRLASLRSRRASQVSGTRFEAEPLLNSTDPTRATSRSDFDTSPPPSEDVTRAAVPTASQTASRTPEERNASAQPLGIEDEEQTMSPVALPRTESKTMVLTDADVLEEAEAASLGIIGEVFDMSSSEPYTQPADDLDLNLSNDWESDSASSPSSDSSERNRSLDLQESFFKDASVDEDTRMLEQALQDSGWISSPSEAPPEDETTAVDLDAQLVNEYIADDESGTYAPQVNTKLVSDLMDEISRKKD